MTDLSLLEVPMVVHTKPAIEMDDEQFFKFCQINDDLQIERTAEGDILIMAPEGGTSGLGSSELLGQFVNWAKRDGRGRVFGPSAGFVLPNKAMRAPDVAWVRNTTLARLTKQQLEKFLPLCPDFVLELRSPSDSLRRLQEKMEEYRDNGAALGWLLDPKTRRAYIYRPKQKTEVLEDPKSLRGENVLRGFTLDVRELWAAMELGRGRR
jgi:Uma2 family endonuclease